MTEILLMKYYFIVFFFSKSDYNLDELLICFALLLKVGGSNLLLFTGEMPNPPTHILEPVASFKSVPRCNNLHISVLFIKGS
ncbi:hypothetical protein Hanom_Chr05g00442251 [Helianthus anomalus]